VDTALWFNGSIENIHVEAINPDYQWAYQWGLFYEHDFFCECSPNKSHHEAPNPIYDQHLMYVMENAYAVLRGEDEPLCTGQDALRALEETIEIMERWAR
jgi:hypothetical protein